MKKVAISACLLGSKCRYDGSDNYDPKILGLLECYELVPFCPEDFCYGTPRPTMDLIDKGREIKVISNLTQADLTPPIKEYAKAFFNMNKDLELFIGKDRSPSCGVCSSKVYNINKELISTSGSGVMAQMAKSLDIDCFDAEEYLKLKKGI